LHLLAPYHHPLILDPPLTVPIDNLAPIDCQYNGSPPRITNIASNNRGKPDVITYIWPFSPLATNLAYITLIFLLNDNNPIMHEGMKLYVHLVFQTTKAGEPSCYCIDEEDGD
jgi:hypothetical protein